MRDLFRDLVYASDVRAVVLTGAGGNFCSGGDVFEIIEPLTTMTMPDLLAFTRMTGDLVKAMRSCPQPIIAAVDGVCAGAGAILAMASDLRLATPEAKTAFLFTRVGLAGADMGACGILPRIIGQGRAAELLFTGRAMTRRGGPRLGLLQRAASRAPTLEAKPQALARSLADGPWFAHGMTKTMLNQEWAMGLDEMIEVGGAGAGDLHGDRRFPPRLRGLRRQAQARLSRATEMRAPVRDGPDRDCLDWPFFDAAPSRACAERLDAFVALGALDDDRPPRRRRAPAASSCARSARPGCSTPPSPAPTAAPPTIDSRLVCLARETLAWHDGLADFAFAMQGLGSGRDRPRRLARARSARSCRRSRAGDGSPPSRLSEKEAGSDVAAMACAARAEGDAYVLDGEKTWISNGGIADVYTVFARTGEAPGARGISAFVVFPDDPGFSIAERIEVIAPHPLATLRFENCRIPASRRLGAPGEGFKIAMRDARHLPRLGRRRRARLRAPRARRGARPCAARRMFGATLADLQLTQAALGEMATRSTPRRC